MQNLKAIDIIKKFPKIYAIPLYDPKENLLCFVFECGKALYPLILQLPEDIQKILDLDSSINIQVAQLKEKLSGLCFYVHGDKNSDMSELIGKAELQSEKTCEICGKNATQKKSGIYVQTRCNNCSEISNARLK